MSNILEMYGIKKSFGAICAVKDVDFSLEQGTIHALIGENGAGKSTLMNILGGVIHADSGKMTVEGSNVSILSPSDAKKLGIAFIHQELNVVNDLTVYENMFLGSEITKKSGFIDVSAMCAKTKEVLDQLEIDLDPKTLVNDLNASYKQIVEISKAIMLNARIIIMDEPTTSLTNIEIEHVFEIMRTLKKCGVSIIFISHKLKEVISICDRFTVLRDGVVVAVGDAKADGLSEIDLARHMVGRDIQNEHYFRQRELGGCVLEVQDYHLSKCFSNINFYIRKGEIVGFTGLLGDGRSDLFQSLFGVKKGARGCVLHNGKAISINNAEQALKEGLGYVPRNRKENGIIKDLSILGNITIVTLKKFARRILIDHKKEIECCNKYMEQLRIKMSDAEAPITSLSGGNQQKIVLAKWLESSPSLLILDNPTQGVDVGAKNEIYSIISNLANDGMSIIVLSSEAQEVLRVCDRIYVMYHGTIVGELSRKDADEEKIMILATGGSIGRSA